MSNIQAYTDYFKSLAENHTDILHSDTEKHFFMMDINDLLSSQNSTAYYPAIVLIKLTGSIVDRYDDNPLNSVSGGFVVLDHCKEVDDFDTQLEIFQNTFSIGMNLIARILHDQQEYLPLALAAIPGFDPNTVRWEMIGPVFDNHFGIIFKFPVQFTTPMDYDAEKWLT